MKRFISRVSRRLDSKREEIDNFVLRKRVRNHDFTIICSNCWGSRVYQEIGIKYNTPFVGLFLVAPCYIKLLGNLRHYLNSEMKFVNKSKYSIFNETRKNHNNYPVGLLRNEVEIHFQHYKSQLEAEAKWFRRLQRMNLSDLFVTFSDRDLCTEELLQAFDKLPFKHKVCFTAKRYPRIQSAIYLPEYKNEPFVGDIYTDHHAWKRHFDVADWLNGGTGKNSIKNIARLFYLFTYL